MKYLDPHKFDHYDDEPSDSEYWRLNNHYFGDYGESHCYDGSPPKLTETQKERLRLMHNPPRDYDDLDVKLGLIKASELDPIVNFITIKKPIENPTAAEFNWRWQTTSNASSQTNSHRQYIRLGKLETKTKNFQLWGFASWQEFNAHLAYDDKPRAYEVYQQLSAEVALSSTEIGDYKFCFWLPKSETQTYSRWWAISVDTLCKDGPGRDIFIYNAGSEIVKGNLSLAKKNTLSLKI